MITPRGSAIIEIEGCNGGDWWPVAGPDQWTRGVALADEDSGTDFDGMYDAPLTALYNSTAFQVGADFGGIREDKYDFILAFHVMGTDEISWEQIDSQFRLAWSARRDTTIWVTTENSRRSLPVRLVDKIKVKAINDPISEQYGLVLVPLVGAYPRWIEAPLISTYITTTDTTGGGVETGYVEVDNPLPYDYEINPQWVVQGSAGIVWTIPDFSWGNDEYERAELDVARKIVMPPLIEGEHLLIETDKMARHGQVVSSLDTQVYARMNGKRFMYGLPGRTPRTQIPVSVTGAPIGAGIQVRCPRPWPRPWGLE